MVWFKNNDGRAFSLTMEAVVKMKILRWWKVLRPLGKEKHHPIMIKSVNNMAAKIAQRKLDAL
jgi:hypothetical protein